MMCCIDKSRVHTDHGKVWKVWKFNVEIFKALKMIIDMEKSGKILENYKADLGNAECIC